MTPDFMIIADGEDVTATIRDRLVSLTITDDAGYKSDKADIELDDRDGVIVIPDNRTELVISMGYKGALVEMGRYVTGEATASGSPDRITISAKAPDMEGTLKEQKTRKWENKTIRDIVTAIAGEHDLAAAISAAHADFKYKHLAQQDESDMHLLTRISRDHDAIATVKDGRLLFATRGAGETVDGDAMSVHVVRRNEVSNYRATLNGRSKYKSVIASYHDTKKAKKLEIKNGDAEPVYRLRHVFATKAEAESAAKAKADELRRGTDTLSLSMPGRAAIAAEARLQIVGFREKVDGAWSIKSVTHKLDRRGFTTSVEAEQPNDGANDQDGDGAGSEEGDGSG